MSLFVSSKYMLELKSKKREATLGFGTFVMLFRTIRCVVGHENLEDEWYVVTLLVGK